MTMTARHFFLWLLLAALLTGCASPAVSYYQLTPADEQADNQVSLSGNPVIGIGPVSLREHLDRPQIATRPASNRIDLAEYHRWVEQPADNISWVLRENLSKLLQTDRIVLYPWDRSIPVDFQLKMEVLHFEGTGSNQVLLTTLWEISGPEGNTLVPRQESSYRVTADSGDHADLVAALSEALSRFSIDVAEKIPHRGIQD